MLQVPFSSLFSNEISCYCQISQEQALCKQGAQSKLRVNMTCVNKHN